jgi:outer membrane receptor protein involved in Fe transport
MQPLRNRLGLVFSLVFSALAMLAQTETGQITGTVFDPSGAIIANSTVTVKSPSTGLNRRTTTTGDGTFSFPNLPPGVYTLSAESAGFATIEQQVQLTVGAKVGVDLKLRVGAAATVVEVSATAGAVNTETQTVSTNISTREVTGLPTLTRNPYDLVLTAGNVSSEEPASEFKQSGGGVGVAINGLRASSANVLLDGAANNNEYTTGVGMVVPLDSVEEFSIVTNNFTAEFGRASAGVINVVTKGGSNDFHGSAYEFNRVAALAANTFDNNANGIAKPGFTRNEFGYSIGGPIKKNKLFFFNNVEWTRVRSANVVTALIPTPDLIAQSAPATQNYFKTYGGLRSNLNNLSTLTRAQLSTLCPAGSTCANFAPSFPMLEKVAYNVPSDSGGGPPQNAYALDGRVDYNFSDKTLIYGRYAKYNQVQSSGTFSNSPYAGYDTPQSTFDQNYVVSMVHTFTPNLVSQSKLMFSRYINAEQPLGAAPVSPALYWLTNAASTLGTSLVLPGYLPTNPRTSIPFGGPQNVAQVFEDVTYIKGKHNFRFGGSFSYLQLNLTSGASLNSEGTLGSNLPNGMTNFLAGQLFQFGAAVDPQGKYPCVSPSQVTPQCTVTLPVGPPNFSRSDRYREFAYYIQDSFRVTPRFTLNLGLRWEYFGVQHNNNPQLDSNFYLGTSGSIYQKIAQGQVMLAPQSPVGGLWAKDFGDYAPRIGFAWDIFGDGKTSFRGGYGIGYERNFGAATFSLLQNPPNYLLLSLTSGTNLPTIPIPISNVGPLSGSVGSAPIGAGSLKAVDPNITNAYAHTWSLSLERQLANNVLAAVDYNGSEGVNLFVVSSYNQQGMGNEYLGIPCTQGSCTARLNTQYAAINWRGQGGYSNYNGATFRLELRNLRSTGLNLRSTYTWSHAIDNASSNFGAFGNTINQGFLDPFNPGLDKGNSGFDIRHRVTLSADWEIPFAKSSRGTMRQILDGWTVAPIVTAYSGAPYSLYDSTHSVSQIPRAMFDGPVPISATPVAVAQPNTFELINLTQYKPDSSFISQPTFTSSFGPFPATMTGRNVFRGPGRWNMDLGIYKSFRLTERFKLQLRGEMFRALNHSDLILVQTDDDVRSIAYSDAKKGVVANGPNQHRDVQLALKLMF